MNARNTYHQINRAQREWKEEQIQILAAIVRLYRGETERYLELVTDYTKKADESIKKLSKEDLKKLEESSLIKKLNEIIFSKLALPKFSWNKEIPKANKQQLAFGETLTDNVAALKELDTNLKTNKDAISELWTVADKVLKQKNDKSWTDLELNNLAKALDELQQTWESDIEKNILSSLKELMKGK